MNLLNQIGYVTNQLLVQTRNFIYTSALRLTPTQAIFWLIFITICISMLSCKKIVRDILNRAGYHSCVSMIFYLIDILSNALRFKCLNCTCRKDDQKRKNTENIEIVFEKIDGKMKENCIVNGQFVNPKQDILLLANYPAWWGQKRLKNLLEDYGKVVDLKIIIEGDKSESVCSAQFETAEMAKRAALNLNKSVVDKKLLSAKLKKKYLIMDKVEVKPKTFGKKYIRDEKLSNKIEKSSRKNYDTFKPKCFSEIPQFSLCSVNHRMNWPSEEENEVKNHEIRCEDVVKVSNEDKKTQSKEERNIEKDNEENIKEINTERLKFIAENRANINQKRYKNDFRLLRMGDDPKQPVRKVCIFFLKGICNKLSKCTFMHFWPEDICQDFIRGGCNKDCCDLVHVDTENRIFVPINGKLRKERQRYGMKTSRLTIQNPLLFEELRGETLKDDRDVYKAQLRQYYKDLN